MTAQAWVKIGIITALFALLFWPNLRRLWDKTNPFYGETNWAHSIFIPLIGLYYLYVNREALRKADAIPFLWGSFLRRSRLWAGLGLVLLGLVYRYDLFVIPFVDLSGITGTLGNGLILLGTLVVLLDWSLATILFGVFLYGYGIWPGRNDFVKDFGMVTTLFGVVLLLCGWQVMRIAWFPIVFLVCGIPWPGIMYSRIATPLQVLAAKTAVKTLNVAGVFSVEQGTKIIIDPFGRDRILNVAEACAGLRSLMTFITIGGAIAFLSMRPLWQKLLIVFSAIPIAIFCNVMRVSGQGLLDYYVSEQLSLNFAHQFVGLVMLVPAFFLILLVAWILDRIFIEESSPVKAAFEISAHSKGRPVQGKVIEVPRRTIIHPVPSVHRAARPSADASATSKDSKREEK